MDFIARSYWVLFLGNLQGGKISQLDLFGYQLNVSMGAILYSGIYFATDLLNEKFGKAEANRAVMLGFVAQHSGYAYFSAKH